MLSMQLKLLLWNGHHFLEYKKKVFYWVMRRFLKNSFVIAKKVMKNHMQFWIFMKIAQKIISRRHSRYSY